MNRYVSIAGGSLISLSILFPFVSIMGISVHGYSLGGKAVFYVIVGLIIAGVGYANRRWLNILSVVLALLMMMLAIGNMDDADKGGAKEGIGLWVMLIGGLISLVGAIWGMFVKKAAPPTAG